MNTSENQISFEWEKKTCSNIYEILAHPAVFRPLFFCLYPYLPKEKIDNFLVDADKMCFLKDETNLHQILDFFKSKENVKKFVDEVEKFYLEHKEALDRAWINDSHKNTYSIAIATLRQFEVKENTQISVKNTSIKLNQESNDLIKKVQDKFEEILSQIYPGYEIIWDNKWNLVNINNFRYDHWEIYDFFDKKIMAFNKWYIDIDTRKPVLFNNHELCLIRRRTVLPNWEVVFEVEVKWEQIKMDKLMISETEEYKFEWKEILGFWETMILPNWNEVLRIFLTIENHRLITKENKIYKVPFEGIECEVSNYGVQKQILNEKNLDKLQL